jgi:FKBP-type peptidyl-prolyl cis-trans isomerase
MKMKWICLAAVMVFAATGCNETKSGGASTATSETPATTQAKPAEPAPAAASGSEVTMSNGLKYQDLKVGDGAMAENGANVSVHYTGWLTDGTKFDSSVDRGQPFQFKLGTGSVIRGWDEGVKGMRVGGKRKLTIPAELGYGAAGAGGVIPPNATLVFDVELLGVN